MMLRTSRATALALIFSSIVGCNTIHPPTRPGVAMIMKGGSPVFVRDGQEFEHGFAGGGLVDAVEGNPGALEHAETYRDFNIAGFVLSVVAVVPLAAGMVVLGVSAGERGGEPSTGAIIGTATLVGGGLALSVTGLVFTFSAQPHLYDAINVYNDSVYADEESGSAAPPGGPPRPLAPERPGNAPLVPTAPAPAVPPPAVPPPAVPPPAVPPPA